MPSVLALISKSEFEKRHGGSTVGQTLDLASYQSTHAALRPLLEGGDLYLVTVRPGDELWLVAVLHGPTLGKTGWTSKRANRQPIVNMTSVAKKLKFTTGKGVSSEAGMLGMSLQTPRTLLERDLALLGKPPKVASKGSPRPAPAAKKRTTLKSYDTFLQLREFSLLPPPQAVPVEEEALAEWEQKHGLELPPDFRAFLLAYGDGAQGFPVQHGSAPQRRVSRILELTKAELDNARLPTAVDDKGVLPGRLPHGYTIEFCPFLTVKANPSMVSKRYDWRKVLNGMLPLGDADDGSPYYLALNGKAAGKLFIFSEGNEYQGMFSTGKTFTQLMEAYIAHVTPQLRKRVGVTKDIAQHGVAVWKQSKHAPAAIMKELRAALASAEGDRAACLLDIAAACESMTSRDGTLDNVGQQLVYALKTCFERGQGALLSELLDRHLAAPKRSKLAPVLSDLAMLVLLDDASDGKLDRDYAKALRPGARLNRTGDVCRRRFGEMSPPAQQLIVKHLPLPVMVEVLSVYNITTFPDEVRARLIEHLRLARVSRSTDLTWPVGALAVLLNGCVNLAGKGTLARHSKKSMATPLVRLLPLLANAATVLDTSDARGSEVSQELERLVANICAAAAVPEDRAAWVKTFEASLATSAKPAKTSKRWK